MDLVGQRGIVSYQPRIQAKLITSPRGPRHTRGSECRRCLSRHMVPAVIEQLSNPTDPRGGALGTGEGLEVGGRGVWLDEGSVKGVVCR